MALADQEEAGQILSQDARGRVLVGRERRDALLEEYDRSGMSGVRFAKYVGIKYTTLAYWLKRRRRLGEREKLKAQAGTKPGRGEGVWIDLINLNNVRGFGLVKQQWINDLKLITTKRLNDSGIADVFRFYA